MKKINNKIWVVYGILIVYLFLLILFPSVFKQGIYTKLIQQILWFGLALYCYYASEKESFRNRDKTGKIQIVVIFTIIYLMIYFVLGLLFGYKVSPYSHSITAILSNIWVFIPVIIFQEYIRAVLVRFTRRNDTLLVIIFLLFSLIELNYGSLGASFATKESAFKYVSSTLLPILTKNALFTYFALVCDYLPSMIFRVAVMAANILLPIFPDLDWFVTGLLELATYVIMFISVNYMNDLSKRVAVRSSSRKAQRTSNPKVTIPLLVILLAFVCFVAGFFTYRPIAIVSDSMVPKFARGDAVVVKKLSNKEKKALKKNDIVQYTLDGRTIVHRIHKKIVDENGNITYQTKGDNNNAPDDKIVTLKQIKGKVTFVVPYAGWPSVLIYDFLKE